MGILSRLSDILLANLARLLDRLENPELQIAPLLRQMEQGLAQARRCAAHAIAGQRRIGRELARHRAEAQLWKKRTSEALAAGREESARRALARKREHDVCTLDLETQHEAALQASESARAFLREFEARLAAARCKHRSLSARQSIPDPDTDPAPWQRLEDLLCRVEVELAARAEVNRILGRAEADG